MPRRPSIVVGTLSLAFLALGISYADPGESREEIIARYGKPHDSLTTSSLYFKQGSFETVKRTVLCFSSKGAPAAVTFSPDGKSVEEFYSWPEDVGQARVMEILLRYSKGRSWGATKLDHPDIEMEWKYDQAEAHMHAVYKRCNNADLYRFYYGLTITP